MQTNTLTRLAYPPMWLRKKLKNRALALYY